MSAENLALDNQKVIISHEDQDIEESGFNVDVINSEDFVNSNKDINQILNTTAGINIRFEGGLGSDFKLALNGLSDKQIRYFIDGMPMENFGTALTLDNLPTNAVERIEVYKGVIPITLGADALGGAINIITPSYEEDFLDASYSYGSFDTHKIGISGQATKDNQYFSRLSLSHNRSDNDYEMKSVPNTDELGNIIGSIKTKRFNDQYTSRFTSLDSGVINKDWAKLLALKLTVADNKNNRPHPSHSINKVLGEYYTRSKTELISGQYKNTWNKFDLSSYLLSGKVTSSFFDTASKRYFWDGSFTPRDENQGELGNKSIFDLDDKIIRGNIMANYSLSDTNKITLNLVSDRLNRSGADRIDDSNTLYSKPSIIEKSILAAGLENNSFNSKLHTNLFFKHYRYSAELHSEEVVEGEDVIVKFNSASDHNGYGLSSRYRFNENFIFKTSYEKTYRLPEADETLGDGQFILMNPDLKPENSDNFNIGLHHTFSNNFLYSQIESNIFYRNANEYIRFVADQVVRGKYKNVSEVDIKGIELSTSITINEAFHFSANATYQDLINRSSLNADGTKNFNYGNRMPNEPYLFAYATTGYSYLTDSYNKISINWSTNYVHEYFLSWEGSGDKDTKATIDEQLTHDLELEYSLGHGKYNITLAATNIFDSASFDNYKIQKPSKAYSLKLRVDY